jgi:hypothetical protein
MCILNVSLNGILFLSWPKLDYEAHKEYKKLIKNLLVLEKKKLEEENNDKNSRNQQEEYYQDVVRKIKKIKE